MEGSNCTLTSIEREEDEERERERERRRKRLPFAIPVRVSDPIGRHARATG